MENGYITHCRIEDVVELGLAKRVTASSYPKQRAEIAVLSEFKLGRQKLFVHDKYLDLLLAENNAIEPYARAERAP